MNPLMRIVRLALYYGIARRLPASTTPAGSLWRSVRRRLTTPLFDSAGVDINVERGARFGTGRKVVIGDRSGIGIDCQLFGRTIIGSDVMIGPEVLVFTTNHNYADTSRPMLVQGMTEEKPVVIDDDVWIGARAIILPGVVLGRGVIVGAGAVVSKSVPPYAVVAGSPARVVRWRTRSVVRPE